VRAALVARAAADGLEPRAAGELVRSGEAQIRQLCATLQAGDVFQPGTAETFVRDFEGLVGGAAAAQALLPQVVSLLPDAERRKAVGMQYARSYLVL
jgi:hypothetical protein